LSLNGVYHNFRRPVSGLCLNGFCEAVWVSWTV